MLVGGGGGGYYFDSESQSFNVGAGGGAGMQFANLTDIMIRHHPKGLRYSSLLSNLTFHSIGGGGGCGTCADPTDDIHSCTLAKKLFTNSSDTILTCGFKKDDDALDDTTLRQLLSSFRQFTSECREITIYGGGGGGGGTSLCCQPFHVGYGFSFSLHYVNDPNLPQSEMFYNFHSEQEESKSSEEDEFRISHDKSSFNTTSGPLNIYPSEDMRYQYDFIGKLLHDSSTICNGFGSWCCVCNATQVVIKDCLKLNLTISDYSTRRNLTAIDSTCRDIQINYARISWLVDQSCCHNYETKDEVGTTSLEHKGEEDHDNVIVINETILNNYYQFYQIPKSLFLSSLQKRGKSFYHIIVKNGDKFISTDQSVTDPHNIHNGSSTIERSQNHFNLFHYKNQTLIKLLQEFQSNPIFNTHTNKTIINNSEIFRCQKNINYYSDRIRSFPYDYSNFDTILMKPSNNSTNTSFFFSNSSQLDLLSSVFDSNMFSMASSTVYRCGSLFIFILLLIFLICQRGELIKRIKECISIAVKDDRLKHDILRPPSLSQEYPSNKYGSV